MKKVTVYGFTIEDQGKRIAVPSKRTADGIAEVGGIVIAGSAEEVNADDLRPDGRHLRKWGEVVYPQSNSGD
jgi:hypothetical protein